MGSELPSIYTASRLDCALSLFLSVIDAPLGLPEMEKRQKKYCEQHTQWLPTLGSEAQGKAVGSSTLETAEQLPTNRRKEKASTSISTQTSRAIPSEQNKEEQREEEGGTCGRLQCWPQHTNDRNACHMQQSSLHFSLVLSPHNHLSQVQVCVLGVMHRGIHRSWE